MDMVPGPEVVRTLSFVDEEALGGAARVGNPTVGQGAISDVDGLDVDGAVAAHSLMLLERSMPCSSSCPSSSAAPSPAAPAPVPFPARRRSFPTPAPPAWLRHLTGLLDTASGASPSSQETESPQPSNRVASAPHSSDVEEEADAPLAGKKAKVHCRSPFAPVLVDITDMTYTDAAGMAAVRLKVSNRKVTKASWKALRLWQSDSSSLWRSEFAFPGQSGSSSTATKQTLDIPSLEAAPTYLCPNSCPNGDCLAKLSGLHVRAFREKFVPTHG
jgi:hypothetical protein